ncbi:PREDICTED: dystrobrevin beta-like [Acropora digitifera]|uniref:dystrobrevin beta-like n=1 Tax=Acropora digitifera TaxID=70779 RepID=UPI00077AB7C4|nr:PREDICTED: dystrobrevin beta-like [Acropora digitifera]
MDATTSPILARNIMNESIPKDEADQLLQDLFHEMSEEGFDEIRFAAYRTAAKLLFIQRKTNLHLVDVFNMIEAFRENGLNTLDHNTELHETRLEAIVSSIFYALNKRLPTTHYIDVERSISLVTNWLLYAYDSDAIGRMRVLSVKTALSTLCAGRLVDKLRYHFSQIEDDNGLLNFPKFEAYLRELLQISGLFVKDHIFFLSLRYKCLHCYNYTLCQDCFWRGKLSQSHKLTHDVREYSTWNAGEKGSSFRSKFLCGGGRKKRPSLPEFPREPEPNKTLDVTNIVPPLPSDLSGPNQYVDYVSNSVSPESLVGSSIGSSNTNKLTEDLDGRMDDEHKLISRYAARLAANSRQKSAGGVSKSSSQTSIDVNKEQRDLMQTLQNKNRLLLKEIRRLRDEHEEASRSAAQIAQNPQLLAELKLLRQRKDELELRMSALQESRRELMVQLEGLMNLLKAGSPRTQRSPKTQRMAESSARDIFGSSPPAPSNIEPSLSSNPSSLSGVDGDIKEAFGDRSAGRNLRDDLLLAADSVTSAMSSLVKELNSEDEDDMEVSSRFANGKTNDTDLDVLEQQVNQIRQSLESHDERANTSFANGDVTMTEPSQKIISHGPRRGGKGPKGRRVVSEGDTDTDDDDSQREVRRGDYKSSSRTQMTDDESYIQTDDDTIRTDDEDMEWQEAIKRWVNR